MLGVAPRQQFSGSRSGSRNARISIPVRHDSQAANAKRHTHRRISFVKRWAAQTTVRDRQAAAPHAGSPNISSRTFRLTAALVALRLFGAVAAGSGAGAGAGRHRARRLAQSAVRAKLAGERDAVQRCRPPGARGGVPRHPQGRDGEHLRRHVSGAGACQVPGKLPGTSAPCRPS